VTYYDDDQDEEDEPEHTGPASGRGSRIVTWIVVGAVVLIAVNIVIAAVGGKKPKAARTPTRIITVRPTAPAPSSLSTSAVPEVQVRPSQVAPSLPLPSPRRGASSYPLALGALTVGGDVVLLNGDTGNPIITLFTHEPGAPVGEISWDADQGIMYFDRKGVCPTVWRYRVEFGRPELFANGAHPVVSPDGSKVAVVGTGCGPGNAKSDGVAVYSAATGQPMSWIPSPSATPAVPGRFRVQDVDWRPDGAALAVTLTGATRFAYKLVTLRTPPGDLGAAPEIPLLYDFRERFYQLEYVDQRLLFVGHCCFGESSQPSERLTVREPAHGTLTSLLDTDVTSVTADSRGQVRYIAAQPDAAGRLHAIDLARAGGSAPPIRILGGGLLLRVDW
jgi:hypothetical protein